MKNPLILTLFIPIMSFVQVGKGSSLRSLLKDSMSDEQMLAGYKELTEEFKEKGWI